MENSCILKAASGNDDRMIIWGVFLSFVKQTEVLFFVVVVVFFLVALAP